MPRGSARRHALATLLDRASKRICRCTQGGGWGGFPRATKDRSPRRYHRCGSPRVRASIRTEGFHATEPGNFRGETHTRPEHPCPRRHGSDARKLTGPRAGPRVQSRHARGHHSRDGRPRVRPGEPPAPLRPFLCNRAASSEERRGGRASKDGQGSARAAPPRYSTKSIWVRSALTCRARQWCARTRRRAARAARLFLAASERPREACESSSRGTSSVCESALVRPERGEIPVSWLLRRETPQDPEVPELNDVALALLCRLQNILGKRSWFGSPRYPPCFSREMDSSVQLFHT